MAASTIRAVFPCGVQTIWAIVTDLTHCEWRSDLSRTEVLDERRFIEYTANGYATEFTVTAEEPCRRWEFDMENSNIKGHWRGIFTEKNGQTEIEFTEEVTAKHTVMKLFVGAYLRRQQKRYIADLQRAVTQHKGE